MSGKPILILFHGMGVHTADSFKDEVVSAANNALGRYEGYGNIKFEDKVEIVSIGYDKHFEKIRQQLADNASDIADVLKTKLPDVDVPNLVKNLLDFESSLGDDEFAYTHILDVVLYMTEVGQFVRSQISEEIVKVIHENHHRPIHVLCHSLGGAVAHDALNQIYTNDNSPLPGQLHTRSFPITSYWAFSNVSRLVTSFTGLPSPFNSVVKPGHQGFITKFFNIRHVLDPFTLKAFKRFDPNRQMNWLTPDTFKYDYKQIVTTKVSRKNTHDIGGYIEDPDVCHDFINAFFDFYPPEDVKKAGDIKFKNIQGEYLKIKEYVDEFEGMNLDGIDQFLNMIQSFTDYIREVGDE
ncbi:MAG: hypothetical protein GY787_26940 [Alteromonadales bacterium]|nr:hypothetical protein [Alteromonadales bacterium]